MKKSILTTMKISIAAAAVLFIVFISCGKQTPSSTETLTSKETSKSKFSTINDLAALNPFNRRVGAPIDGSIGDQWISNFKNKYGYNKTYTLNNSYLQSIVNQSNCVGICLFYARDNNNKTHVLPIGVDVNGKVMKNASVITMDGNINWVTSQQWISNYYVK